jgi:hypothetical protein
MPENGRIADYQTHLDTKIGKEQHDFLRKNFYAYGSVGMVWLIGDN